MKNKRNKTILTIVLAVAAGFGLLGFGSIKQFFGGSSGALVSTRSLAMGCTLDMYTRFHIHPRLRIVINGAEQIIPASIGVSPSCMHPLHTHDTIGTIHIESPEQRDFTLGDFFAVWNKPFDKSQVLDYKADATHEIVMAVGGQPSDAYENLIFKDNQQIVIEYKSKK
ncbi:MAG: hypothetical protein HY433_01535 [Candidatus Liptonbacteria bacterium]|nr:hypothetical protein [Candidatus Liptonbacteria bacterium]